MLGFPFFAFDYHPSYLYARLLILAHLGYVANMLVANSAAQIVASDVHFRCS